MQGPHAADAGRRTSRHPVAEATMRVMKSSFCSGFQKGLRCISATEAAMAGARGWSRGTAAAFLARLLFSSCAQCRACPFAHRSPENQLTGYPHSNATFHREHAVSENRHFHGCPSLPPERKRWEDQHVNCADEVPAQNGLRVRLQD